MKCIKIDLPMDLPKVEIEPLYDLHIGSKKCNYAEIERRIRRVLENDNVYAILGGDIINNSTINSVAASSVYDEPLTPMQQIHKAVEMIEPIKTKILGVVSGNHERRASKDGIDLTQLMCYELGLQERYDVAGVLIFLRFGFNTKKQGKTFYSIYATHGSGGGGMIGGKANKLSKVGQVVDADVVIVGHTHSPLTFRECSFKVNGHNNTVTKFEQVFVNASATLDYEEYAELYGMKPSVIKCPIIELYQGRNKLINVIS